MVFISEVKLVFSGPLGFTRNWSSKLELCLGDIVLPKLYFSPDGDLGGVKPFWVGELGYFCIFVMKRGDGGAIKVGPGYFDSISFNNFLIS